jgi:glucan biosynthesis protein C
MRKLGEFHVGRMSMSAYLDMTEHFYQRYMWFLSLLLIFFLAFILLYKARETWAHRSRGAMQGDTQSGRSIYPALAVVGLLSVLLFALAKFITSSLDDPLDVVWFSLGNVVQFEAAKLAFYIPYFGLGVYAYSHKWFVSANKLGQPWAWGVGCLLLTALTMLAARSMTRAAEPSLGLQVALAVLQPLWTLSLLVVFLVSAARHWNRSTPLNRTLAANSYHMYLVHYLFVLTLPMVLSGWTSGAALVKFGIVVLLTIVLSYGVSRYIARPHPRLLVVGLGVLSVLLAVFV